MLGHVFHYLLNSDIYSVFDYSFIDVSDDALDHSKLLEEFATCIKYFLRENIFFSINPQIRKAFLSRIKYFSQIAKTSFFIEYFVGFRELLSVTTMCAGGFKYFA